MKKYRYNVKYEGATISSNTMIGVSRLIANISHEPISIVYKKLVGRYPSTKQLEEAYSYKNIWQKAMEDKLI